MLGKSFRLIQVGIFVDVIQVLLKFSCLVIKSCNKHFVVFFFFLESFCLFIRDQLLKVGLLISVAFNKFYKLSVVRLTGLEGLAIKNKVRVLTFILDLKFSCVEQIFETFKSFLVSRQLVLSLFGFSEVAHEGDVTEQFRELCIKVIINCCVALVDVISKCSTLFKC